ncbi:3-oxo-5-alpha-steroid 4-dehydrogenase 1 isoform X1 [Sorex araneus]|uniref:3-oxo-5-alpha-steroid 4-dehydrogenase 1 isoform X1 n=1 Tax=Sorex araneus TaxID=42254 RepID=UPI002433AE38|nr:3-oxo-5-alpha-steroid 4-dehydrogenase 1 isoform X1 [Sorex araneus]
MELEERRALGLLAALLALLGCLVFALLQGRVKTYGRHGSRRGPWVLPARLSWVLQELPSLLAPLACACSPAGRLHHWPNRLLLAMFVLHYAHRSLVFPLLIRGGKPVPLEIFLGAALFCAFNGYLQGRYLSTYAVYPDDWLTDPRFLLGSVLWLVGLLINVHSDHILRSLRKPGDTGYQIPRGGLFEHVSAANFFGELVEWAGYALASWSLQAGAFAFFSFCFLFPRAKQHHRWYLEKFEDYPKSRRILIPFLL